MRARETEQRFRDAMQYDDGDAERRGVEAGLHESCQYLRAPSALKSAEHGHGALWAAFRARAARLVGKSVAQEASRS
jgi:hypothetical protein